MYLGRLAAALMTPNTMFQLECSEAGGVVADHNKGQDTRQSTIAILTEVDEDAITVSW